MSDLVPTADIERIVGMPRHRQIHYGRAVSSEKTVYILHSQECLDSGIDVRDCEFSLALDEGIELHHWTNREDTPVELNILNGCLIPLLEAES